MNKRYVGILVLLALVIGAGAVYMRQRDESARPALAAQIGQPLFKDLRASDVASIVIRNSKGTLTLERKDKQWSLAERNDFPADLDKVSQLVLKAIELKIGRAEAIDDKDRARLGLLDPDKGAPGADAGATSIAFKRADGHVLARLLVGHNYYKAEPAAGSTHSAADGRFVMLPEEPHRVFIVSDPLSLATTASESWVSKEGIAAKQVKSIEVKRDDGEGYSIERRDADAPWTFAGAKIGRPDQSKANAASYDLGDIRIVDVAGKKGPEQNEYGTVVTASTFDGLHYALHIGPLEKDLYKVVVDVEGTPVRKFEARKDEKPDAKAAREKTYAEETARIQARIAREKALKDYVLLVHKSTLADLLKKRSELLEQKKAAAKKP